MPAFNKFNSFVYDLCSGVHNFQTHSIRVALTNTAPVAGNSLLSQISQIDYTNASSRTLSLTSAAQTGGVFRAIFQDLTITAAGGSIGPFRYVVFYNDTPTSPLDPLIGWVDYGSSVTVLDTKELVIDLNNVNGLFSNQ